MTTTPRYQIELANKIGRINGRVCAVGNAYIVTRRPDGYSGELVRFATREEARAWITERSAP
jgi:hypothetical protein